MIRFSCSHCGSKFKVSDDKGGKTVKCTKCGGSIRIPMSTVALGGGTRRRSGALETAAGGALVSPQVAILHLPMVRFINGLLGKLRFWDADPDNYGRGQARAWKWIAWGILLVTLFQVPIYLVVAAKFKIALLGVLCVVAPILGVLLHYLSARFLYANWKLVESHPYFVPSFSILDAMAVICVFFGLVNVLLAVLLTVVFSGSMALFIGLLLVAGFFFSLAVIMLNPTTCLNLQVKPREVKAGEIVLTLFVAVERCILIAIPIVSLLAILLSFFAVFYIGAAILDDDPGAIFLCLGALCIILVAGLLPFIAYMNYCVKLLVIDVLRSIFDIARGAEKQALEVEENAG